MCYLAEKKLVPLQEIGKCAVDICSSYGSGDTLILRLTKGYKVEMYRVGQIPREGFHATLVKGKPGSFHFTLFSLCALRLDDPHAYCAFTQ